MPPGSAVPLGRRADEARPSPFPSLPRPLAAAPPSPVGRPLPGAGLRRPRTPSDPVGGLGAPRLWLCAQAHQTSGTDESSGF